MANIKKLLHGSRGYINQMIRKYLLKSNYYSAVDADNFSSQELFNFTHSVVKMNKLVPPISKDTLSDDKSLVFKEYFGLSSSSMSSSSNVLIANRCVINNKMYHSINYTRKVRTISYTVSFILEVQNSLAILSTFLR